MGLVNLDTWGCKVDSRNLFCRGFAKLYQVDDYAYDHALQRHYMELENFIKDSPSKAKCLADVEGMLYEYTNDVLFWNLQKIGNKHWMKHHEHESSMYYAIRLHLQDQLDSLNLEYSKSATLTEACVPPNTKKLQSLLKEHNDQLANISLVREIRNVIQSRVWHQDVSTEDIEVLIASQTSWHYPLGKANMNLNVRSGPGVNYPSIDGLFKGEEICLVEQKLLNERYLWVRIKSLTSTAPEDQDRWVYHGNLAVAGELRSTLTVIPERGCE